MTDQRLRELEQRFRETGTIEDEAGWLNALARTNEHWKKKVCLAAFCGHQPSVVAVGEFGSQHRTVEGWAKEAEELHPHAVARACLALLSDLLHHFFSNSITPHDIGGHFNRALQTAVCVLIDLEKKQPHHTLIEEWLSSEIVVLRQVCGIEEEAEIETASITGNAHTLRMPCLLLYGLLEDMNSERFVPAIKESARYLGTTGFYAALTPALRKNLSSTLVPWILGTKDPLIDLLAKLEQTE